MAQVCGDMSDHIKTGLGSWNEFLKVVFTKSATWKATRR